MKKTVDYPELLDPEWLKSRYIVDNMSASEIADELGFDVTSSLVHYYLKKAKIPRKDTSLAVKGKRTYRRNTDNSCNSAFLQKW